MGTLHRYILKEMLATIVVAVGVCAGLLLLGNLLKEILSLLMSGQATLGLVLRGIGLLVPFILAFALPMGALTASLLVYGRLSADQELTAARANGISLMALAIPAMVLSLVLCGVCAWINLDLAPRCRVAYKGLFKALALQKAQALIPEGRFVTEFPNLVIYADRIDGKDIQNVLFFQLRDGRKVLDVRAPRAALEYDESTRELRLAFFDGRYLHWIPGGRTMEPPAAPAPPSDPVPALATNRTPDLTPDRAPDAPAAEGPPEEGTNAIPEVEVGTNEVPDVVIPAEPELGPVLGPEEAMRPDASAGSTQAVVAPKTEDEGFWQAIPKGELRVSVTLPHDVVSKGLAQLSDMTFLQLLQERRELLRLGIEDVTPLEVHLHRQVAFSFACFGFALVGIPLGVRAHRRETSVGIAFAIGLVMVYYAFLILAQAFDTRADLAPWLIVWMPNVLFQIIGAWLLWRVNRG